MWSGFRTRCQGASRNSGEASSTAPSHGGGGTAAGSGLAHRPAGGSTNGDQCSRGTTPCTAASARMPCSARLGTGTFGLAGAVPRHGSPRWSGAAAVAVDCQGGAGSSSPAFPATSMDARGRCGGALEAGGRWIRQRGVHRGFWPLGLGHPGASRLGVGAQPASGSWGLSTP